MLLSFVAISQFMRSRFFIMIAALLLLVWQDSVAQTPQEFSKKIEASTTDLYSKAALWGTTFISQYNGDANYGELKAVRVDIQEYIDEQLSYFKEAENVGGSEKLKAAVISFYEYEKSLVQDGFGPFDKLNKSSGDEQVNNCRATLKELSRKEYDFTQALNKERREYAAKNGFSLDPPPPAPKPAPKPVAKKPLPPKPVANRAPAPAASPQPPAELPRGRGEPPRKPVVKEDDEDKDDDKE